MKNVMRMVLRLKSSKSLINIAKRFSSVFASSYHFPPPPPPFLSPTRVPTLLAGHKLITKTVLREASDTCCEEWKKG